MNDQELTVMKPANVGAVVPSHAQGIMDVIARAAADPNTDVAKMERLYAMLKEENARIAEQRFNAAMAAAQAEMPFIARKSLNSQTNSNYAKLEAILADIGPVIKKHNFSLQFSQGEAAKPDEIRIICKVGHSTEDGFSHSETHHIDLSRDDVGMKGTTNKTKVQGAGSTLSYGRRYLTCMIFNLTIGDDNDGNRAGSKPKPVVDASQPVDNNAELRKCAKELWDLLKARKAIIGTERNWQAANAWLWREEVLDAAAQEEAPNLGIERFKAVIEAVKGKPV
jgi:hypothetical protein